MIDKLIKLRKLLVIILISACIVVAVYFLYINLNKLSAMKIESDPSAIVYINGEQIGKTPIEIERKESEVLVRLSPESFSEDYSPFETKVKLTKGVKTILRHDFSVGSSDSETQIVSFEPQDVNSSSIAVVSLPEGASVKVNSKPVGTTPVRIDELDGSQTILVDALGYKQSNITVIPEKGYLLTVFVDLAKADEKDSSIFDFYNQELKAEIVVQEKLEILETPTGFLRVRSEPNVASEEIKRVNTGEIFEKFEKTNSDWYEIIFSATESGFISSEYATVSGTLSDEN